MNFLKQLLGLGAGAGTGRHAGDRSGIYFYVRSRRCNEVIEVRLDRNNDLSIKEYEPMTYYARKLVVGTKCFYRMEAEFWFDKDRRLSEKSVSGGEFVEYEDYLAYIEKEEAKAIETAGEGEDENQDA